MLVVTAGEGRQQGTARTQRGLAAVIVLLLTLGMATVGARQEVGPSSWGAVMHETSVGVGSIRRGEVPPIRRTFTDAVLAHARRAAASAGKPVRLADDVAPDGGGGPPVPPEVVIADHPEGPVAARAAHLQAPFRGLSTWVDLYDTGLSPEAQVGIAAANGVDVIFAQASFASTQVALHAPERLHALIEAAHDRGIRVMVWTIPSFTDVGLDLKRAEHAIGLVTPRGDRPDAFGLDIELAHVADVAERTRRLLDLSARIRGWAGPDYPMAAVVLPPLQLRLNTTWWPGFPYAELAGIYDVAIPMSYSSYRGTDPFTTHVWNRDNVTITQQLAGDLEWPVHLAGGIADNLPEVASFVEAVWASGAIGGGLYDLHTTRTEAWPALQHLSVRSPAAGPLRDPAPTPAPTPVG